MTPETTGLQVDGVSVFVRVLSTAELFELQDLRAQAGLTEEQQSRAFGLALMRMTACDAAGAPIWMSDDEIMKLPAPEFLRVFEPFSEVALRVNGLSEGAEGNG